MKDVSATKCVMLCLFKKLLRWICCLLLSTDVKPLKGWTQIETQLIMKSSRKLCILFKSHIQVRILWLM